MSLLRNANASACERGGLRRVSTDSSRRLIAGGIAHTAGAVPATSNALSPIFDANAAAYFTAISLSDAAQKAALNTFIVSLKSGLSLTNLSDGFDYMYWRAAPSLANALIDMTGNGFNGTAVNTPGQIANQGVTSNGTSSYINNNYNPGTQGIVNTNTSASFFAYVRTLTTSAGVSSGSILGAHDVENTLVIPHYTDNSLLWCINNAGGGTSPGAVTPSTGWWAADITGPSGSCVAKIYQDAVAKQTTVMNNNSTRNAKVYSLCWNNGGPSDFFKGEIALELAGKHFTDAEHVIIKNAVVALKASAAGW